MSDKINDWLQRHGLSVYAEKFLAHRITLDLLPELQEDDLDDLDDLDELEIAPEHRSVLQAAVSAMAVITATDLNHDNLSKAETKSPIRGTVTRAERRHMTVMFIDIALTTKLSSSLDPEANARTLKRFQHLVIDTVEQWEGFVARFFGNGVLAYFGWPSAAANDAERAVHCALDICSGVSQLNSSGSDSLACPIGVATGLVLVEDIVGDRQTYQDAIYGVTPNLAARLQSRAGPDEIIISPATRQLVHRWFTLESRGLAVLKGDQ